MTITRRSFLGRLAGGAVVGLLLGPSGRIQRARAHGDMSWIMDNPKTAYCCNEKDCRQVVGGEVERVDGGWRVLDTGQVFEDGSPHIHPSRDINLYWCRWPEPTVRCLFVPPAGT